MLFKNLPNHLKYKIAASDHDTEATAFLCQPYSLGDAVLDLSLMYELRRRHPGVIITFITSEYIGRARWLLEPAVDRWIFLPHEELYELCRHAVQDFHTAGPGVLNSMSPLDHASPKLEKNLLRSALGELGELPFKKTILGIGINAKPHFPFDLTKALRKDTRLTNSRPSIYVNPRAQTAHPLPKVVVEQICSYLDTLGFTVQLDSHQDVYDLPPSVVQFSCTLQEAVQRAFTSDIVLTYRSGMTDLLAILVDKLIVLYPCRNYVKNNRDYSCYNTVHLGLRQQEDSLLDFWDADFPVSTDFVRAHVISRFKFLKNWNGLTRF